MKGKQKIVSAILNILFRFFREEVYAWIEDFLIDGGFDDFATEFEEYRTEGRW